MVKAMPRYTPLLNQVPEYPFAKVGRLTKEVQERDGIRVINARIGIPDEGVTPTIIRNMSEYIKEKGATYGYPVDVHPSRGIDDLVDAIRNEYKEKRGVELKPENIAVTGWTKSVLHNLPRLYNKGTAVILDPVYPAYEAAAVLSGNNIRRIPTSADTNWLPNFKFSEGDSFFYFCDPNNPTGAVADIKCYEKLLDDMKNNDVGGIFDKAYMDYTFDDTVPFSITQLPELMDYGFEVVSFSKHFNFVGLGLGWVVSSPENIKRWRKLEDQYGQGVPWVIQKAGVEALSNQDARKEMGDYMDIIKERRDDLVKGLNDIGLKCEKPRATPYVWARVPEGYNDESFVLDKLLGEGHVAFMPGSYFGESGKGYFRATLFLSKEDVKETIKRIGEVRDW